MSDAGLVAPDDVIERYVAAVASFGEQVRDVQDHEWDLPTPCVDWDVRAVVAHVVLGESQVAPLVAGESLQSDSEVDTSIVGTHPMSVWRGTAIAAIKATKSPGMVSAMFDHPQGQLRGGTLLSFRVCENLVHAWDVSVAVGRRWEIDADQATWCLDFWLPNVEQLFAMSDFGAAIQPPDNAGPAERLLALLGRSS